MNATATPFNTVEKAVEWLKVLNGQVNKEARGEWKGNMSGHRHSYTRLERIRDLTEPEWKQVVALIKQYELPVEIGSNGFTWVLGIYNTTSTPLMRPNRILSLEAGQVPFPKMLGVEEALEQLSWLTHSPRNKELLAWYALNPPREPSYYMY